MSFVEKLETFGSQTALQNENGDTVSYQDLAQRADSLSEEIGDNKQFIFLKCNNNINTILGYIAALRGGHPVLMLDSSLDLELFEKLVTLYKPNGIWGASDTSEYQYTKLTKQSSTVHPSLSLLLSTSGSTGSPKLVKLTKKNLQSNAESIAEYLKLDSSEVPITTLPLHYSYGLSVINSHLLVGAKILLTSSSIVSKKFWSFFKDSQATSFAGVPYTYEMLQRLKIEDMKLPSLRYMTQAGGKLSSHLVEHFANIAKNKGIQFYIMYGQTEATARISWLPSDKVLSKINSIGIPIPKGTIKLESSTGAAINLPESEGELVYQGDNVMMGYAECANDLADGDQLAGFLKTGDLAKYDSDGFYYITGRLKRFIKIFGNRVNLEEIQNELSNEGYECKCTGEDNLLVIATLNNDGNEIKQYIIDKFHFHHSVIKFFKIAVFPVNSSGKIQYLKLFKCFNDVQKL